MSKLQKIIFEISVRVSLILAIAFTAIIMVGAYSLNDVQTIAKSGFEEDNIESIGL